MNRVKKMWIIAVAAIFSIAMIGCQKDQVFTSEKNSELTEAIQENSDTKHTSALGRRCASKEHMQLKLQDPAFKQAYEARNKAFEESLRNPSSQSRAACNNPTIVPVAIHFQGVNNPNKSCLAELSKRQMTILNNDFQGKNSDLVQWANTASATFPGINDGAACLEFCIATQNHPSGFGLSNGDLAITYNQTNGDQLNKWSGYINIIVNDADGDLGYAPLGGSGNGDAVVISKDAFGAGGNCGAVKNTAPFDLGRTLVHEMGHYLNLDHLWGDGGCNSDDLVSDTPGQTDANEGCPNIGKRSCGSADLHMNYMDYANDACMYMFTAGQASRMMTWYNSGLKNRLKNPAIVCGAASGGGDTTGGGDTGGGDTGGGNTGGSCTVPTGIAAQASGTTVNFSWNDMGATTYRIQYRISGTSWTSKNTTATNIDITGLKAGKTYQYRVRAKCASGWTKFTSIKTISIEAAGGGSTGSENTGSGQISIEVTLDDFGSETEFYIEDGDGYIVRIWGPFADGRAGQKITRNINLPTGLYTFVIEDAFGDGICCAEGAGKWTVKQGGAVIASSNGKFGYWEEFDFAIGGARLSGPASRKDAKDYSKLVKTEKYQRKKTSK